MLITIHIGPHKTGTTAIQTAFLKAARKLRRAGVLYPKTNWHHPAQHRLAFAMKGRHLHGTSDRPDRDLEMRNLLRAINAHKGDQVFISSEEFFSAPASSIQWLASELAPHDVHILTVLRRPDAFLVSCYNQKTRKPGNGFCTPIQHFVDTPRAIAAEIDYLGCLGRWGDAFGDAAIRFEVYEDGPLLPRVLTHLGLSPDFLTEGARANGSVPGAVVELMRHAKAADLSPDLQRRLFQKAGKFFRHHAPFHLSHTDRMKILAAMESDTKALFARFGKDLPESWQHPAPTDDLDGDNLTEPDVMRLIGALL